MKMGRRIFAVRGGTGDRESARTYLRDCVYLRARRGLLVFVCAVVIAGSSTSNWSLVAQDSPTEEYSEEELRQIQLAERFLSILAKNPRRGTAMDRVYGHHIEFGTLDDFVEDLTRKTAATPDDSAQWMLLGLFESQRGEDADAAQAFTKAEELRPEDAMAPYYLSQSLLRIGENQQAVEAMERAIACNPPRTDLLEIFQQLGRVHQRAQRTEEALAVWQRLESLFPNDPRVLEQIAITLAEEGQPKLALTRYEKLAESERDDYRKTMYQVAAAELKIKTQQRSEGIAEFESILNELNPEGWLYRDVRRRIEDVFLRSSDQDSLVQYYEGWIEKHPEDVEAMARLARFLSGSARVPEATEWMEKALKLAPSRSDLRKAFIDQLVEQQRYDEAAKQYKALCEAEPGNVDFLRDWGKLVLRDRSQDLEKRQTESLRIWNLILRDRPDDALLTAQVADLCRNAELKERSFELYKKAIELAPGEPQYREYLGEYYHIEKQPELALETWAGIAAEPYRNAENLARVAEVYNSFGYFKQAVDSVAAAVDLEPKDFGLQIRAAEYHNRAEKYDQALAYVTAAEPLATNDDQRATIIAQRIDVLQSSGRLKDEIESQRTRIAELAAPQVDDWQLLARYLEADGDWPEAIKSIDAALAIDAKSIPALTTAARIAEASGDLGRAADINRRLAETDRRSRGDHLMNVARLEAQLGRADEAMEAANQLIVAAPGNTDNYEFFAQLCFRLGRRDEGLDALRKAIRINPNEPRLTMALGSALAEDLQTREAIELYWRAFDKTDEVEDKTSLIVKLVPLYEQLSQFDQLVERLERDRREEDKRREMTICLAQAHQTANDFGTARYELESLLSENTRDTNLLQQLAKLCQASGDIESAISYQRQLVAIAPGHETEYPLANMLQDFGFREEANEILVRLTQREEDPVRLLRSLDSLLARDSCEAVLEIVEPLISKDREDWELMYREAVALAMLERTVEAQTKFQQILAIDLPHDSLGRSAAAKFKQAQQKARSENLRGTTTAMPSKPSLISITGYSNQIQVATGLLSQEYYSSNPNSVWTPEHFALARMAAYGWLMKFEQESRPAEEDDAAEADPTLVERVAARASQEDASKNDLYNHLYVAALENNALSMYEIAKRLAATGTREEKLFFLSQVPNRNQPDRYAQVVGQPGAPTQKPLSHDELQFVLDIFEELSQDEKDDAQDAMLASGQIVYATNGQAYINVGGTYQPIASTSLGGYYKSIIINQLRLAGRTEQADAMYEAELAKAESANQLAAAMGTLLQEGNLDRVDEFYKKWLVQAKEELEKGPDKKTTGSARGRPATVNVTSQALNTTKMWLGRLGPEEEFDRILEIGDSMLDLMIKEQDQNARASQRSPRSSSNQAISRSTYVQLYYGEQRENQQVQFIAPDSMLNSQACMLLYQLLHVYRKSDLADQLMDHFRKRVDEAEEQARSTEQAMLASLLWWNSGEDEALEMLTELAREEADSGFKLALANLQMQRNQPDVALEIVDTIPVSDQRILKDKELVALRAAERLGDTQRAKLAAERLFGLRLDAQTQLSLIDPMRRLGLSDLASAVLNRAERSSSNQPAAMASLMTMYRGQGRVEDAKKLAHALLRKTTSPITTLMAANQNSRYRQTNSAESTSRTQALQLLQQTGELDSMIAQLKERIESYPDVVRSYELLVEYYEATGKKTESLELMQQIVKLRPKAYTMRMKLAEVYQSQSKYSEACDQYLRVLEDRPSMVANDFYRYEQVFRQAKRNDELIKLLAKMDWRQFRQSYQIVNLVSQLLSRSSETSDEVVDLVERALESAPNYRSQLLRNLTSSNSLKNERLFNLVVKYIVPTKAQVQANPWSGLSEIYSYSSGGKVNTYFDSAINGLKDGEQLKEIESAIRTGLEESPDWLGGKLMLAVVGLKGNEERAADAKDTLLDFCNDEESIDSMPYQTCWILGQTLLEQFPEQRELAIELYEKSLTKETNGGMNQIQYSPVAKLVGAYKESGRSEDARDLLLKQMATSSFDNYDPQYASSQRVEQTVWCAKEMLSLGYPATSIKLYQDVLADTNKLKLASSWRSSNENYYLSQIKQGMDSAIAKIDDGKFEDAINDLFTINEKQAKSDNAFELLLTFPETDKLGESKIESPLLNVIQTLTKKDQAALAVKEKFEALHADRPEDLSIMLLLAILQLQVDPDSEPDVLNDLVEWTQQNALENVAEGRRPNSRQRKAAAEQVPLWLVARATLGTPAWDSHGEMLAQRAVDAAKRQLEEKQTYSVLYEWAQGVGGSNKDSARELWSQLLDIASERPTKRATEEAEETAQRRRAPLTESQFNLAMKIAEETAGLGLTEVSQSAFREALVGGLPVPDPVPTTNAMGGYSSSGMLRIVQSGSTQNQASQSPESKVAIAASRVLSKWQGNGYDDDEILKIVSSFVFPEDSPKQVRLYPDSSWLISGRVTSMGQTLVELAGKSEQLDWLDKQATERMSDDIAAVPATVLRTLIALERSNEDEAKKLLQELAGMLEKNPSAEIVQLACHAAIPASKKEDLKEVAMPILAKATRTLDAPPSRTTSINFRTNVGSLAQSVNRYFASKGTEDQIRSQFEERLQATQQQFANYSGDYGIYQQWLALGNLANEAGSLKASKVALDFMGRACDLQVERYSRPSMAPALAATIEMTRNLDPEEAYNVWSKWSLPNKDRNTLRLIVEWVAAVNVPNAFAKVPASKRAIFESQLLSNFEELVNSAAKCGKLDSLQQRAEQAVQDKLVGADHLLALVSIARAKNGSTPEEAAEKLTSFFADQNRPENLTPDVKRTLDFADLQIFMRCLAEDVYVDNSIEKINAFDLRLRQGSANQFRGILRHYVQEYLSQRNSAQPRELTKQPLSNWVAFRSTPPQGSNRLGYWVGDADSATLVGGANDEYLAFAYPLTGEFEFTVDCYNGDWGECDAGYGGLMVLAQNWGSSLSIEPTSLHETLSRPQGEKTDQPSYGRYRIVSTGDQMQVWLNGFKVYEESLSHTSPWLMLSTEGTRTSRFMNPQITGNPSVPRKVNLFAGDRMDGWCTSAFAETQPRHRIMAEDPGDENSSIRYYQQNEPATFDWKVEDGELLGRKSDDLEQSQSWAFYQRPLRPGETFAYEFFYIPGNTTVAPTIGQLALQLESDGVNSHWITHQELERQITGLEIDNSVKEWTSRLGNKLYLKSNNWNSVELKLEGDRFKLAVNGTQAFERRLEDIKDLRFGLFHFKSTDVKVRNATLSGDWPEDLESSLADGWFQWTQPQTEQQAAVVQAMLPRDLDRPLLKDVVLKSRTMAAEESLNFLKDWVLPTTPDGRIRMGFAYLSLEEQEEMSSSEVTLKRVVSPAIELVKVAASNDWLEELLHEIERLTPRTDVDSRNKHALKILTLMQVDGSDCQAELGELYANLDGGFTTRLSTSERSAEFLVAIEAGKHQRFWQAGHSILHRLRSIERNGENKSGLSDWKSAVSSGLGAIELRWLGKDKELPKQWTSVPYVKPQWNVQGERNSTWLVDRGAATHIPGDHWSQLLYQSPLRGSYEITARRSTHGGKEVSIATGMHAAEPRWDLKATRVATLMHKQEDLDKEISLPVWDQSADFKIVVDAASVTTFVNGVEIHAQEFASPRDPWLVLQASDPGLYGSVRDLRITGTPTIPDEIDLIAIDGWASWRFDYYGDWSAQQEQLEVPYNRVDDEIRGNLRTNRSASPMESLMMYARPMLEDGEIEFETFYKPGEFEVHPAVGGTVFMLDQPKVTLHQLTNAQWDRSGLAKDNRIELPAATEDLMLKEDDWNHVRLKLSGDQLTLFVNDVEVAVRTLEQPGKERFFGLFRYSDLTKCRVRNLKYRGDWPKTLPSLDQQEMAYPEDGPYSIAESEDVKTDRYDLKKPIEELKADGLHILGAKEQTAVGEKGLNLKMTDGATWAKWPGISRRDPIDGYCEITVSYSNLDIKPVASGWGDSLVLQIALDDPQETVVEVAVLKNADGQARTRGGIRKKLPDGQFSTLDLDTITGHNASGRLRLVRDGGRVHCLVAEGESKTFQLIHSLTVGPANIRSFSVQAKSSDDQGAVSAVLSDLTVKETKRD